MRWDGPGGESGTKRLSCNPNTTPVTMINLSEFLYRKANLYLSLALTVIMVLYASLVMGSQSECIFEGLPDTARLLALQFGYDADTVKALFNSMTDEALLCYSRLLRIWDTIFPFIYGSMYISWLSLIFRKQNWRSRGLRLLNLYPILPLVADLCENFFENRLVVQYLAEGSVADFSVVVSSSLTQLKWTLSTLNYLIIATGIILLVIQKEKQGTGNIIPWMLQGKSR